MNSYLAELVAAAKVKTWRCEAQDYEQVTCLRGWQVAAARRRPVREGLDRPGRSPRPRAGDRSDVPARPVETHPSCAWLVRGLRGTVCRRVSETGRAARFHPQPALLRGLI